MVPATALKGLIYPYHLDDPVRRVGGFMSINAELTFPHKHSLRLWSTRRSVLSQSEYDKYQVLDVLALPDRFLVAMVDPAGVVFAAEINIFTGTQLADLFDRDWQQTEMTPLDAKWTAKWAYDDKTKQLTIETTETAAEFTAHRVFAQEGEKWDFKVVRRWTDHRPRPDRRPLNSRAHSHWLASCVAVPEGA